MSIRKLSILFIFLTITPTEAAARRVATALPEYLTAFLISIAGSLVSARYYHADPCVSAAKHHERAAISHQHAKDLIASMQIPPVITLTPEDVSNACSLCYPDIHDKKIKKNITNTATIYLAKKPLSIPELWTAVITTNWHINQILNQTTDAATSTDDENKKALHMSTHFMLALLGKYPTMQAQAEAFLRVLEAKDSAHVT
jgi:hypothetical protein